MTYKIAIATSNGIDVDETFGAAQGFSVYEVTDGKPEFLEKRDVIIGDDIEKGANISNDCGSEYDCENGGGCGDGNGCGSGNGGGCGGPAGVSKKVELIGDCRAVVCKKIGFQVQKQLERKAISAFDVSCKVDEALCKITFYYKRIDNHESLRKQ